MFHPPAPPVLNEEPVVKGETLTELAAVPGEDEVLPAASSASISDFSSFLSPKDEGLIKNPVDSRPDLVALRVLSEAFRISDGALASELSILPVHGTAEDLNSTAGEVASSSEGTSPSSSCGRTSPLGSAISIPRS